jgi:hypothetical protein
MLYVLENSYTTGFAQNLHILGDFTVTAYTTTFYLKLFNVAKQMCVVLSCADIGILQPVVVETAVHLEYFTNQSHRETAITKLYKDIFFFESFTKNTAAHRNDDASNNISQIHGRGLTHC